MVLGPGACHDRAPSFFHESCRRRKTFAAISLAALLGLSLGTAQAQTSGAAKTPVASKKAPAKKTASKTSKGVPAKTARAVEANTPVQSLTPRLSEGELAIAKQIHVGRIGCELGADVTVSPDEKNPGFFNVSSGKRHYYMHPVESRTGAIRMEDGRAGAMWLQLGNKSMLMDQKQGQRVADECQAPAQRDFAAAMKNNPPPDLLGGGKK